MNTPEDRVASLSRRLDDMDLGACRYLLMQIVRDLYGPDWNPDWEQSGHTLNDLNDTMVYANLFPK